MDGIPPFALIWRLLACAAVTALLIAVFGAGAYQRQLYLRTGQLAAATAVISLPISTVLAVAIFRARFPGRRLLQVVLLAQLFFPLYLQAAAWEAGFGRIGWYSIRSGDLDSPWLSGMWGAVWTHVAASVPWATLLLGIGLAAGNRDLEEAALLDEPPRWVLLRVVLPRLIPWWMIAAAWIGISTATDMTAADLYLVDTYPRVIYTGFAFQATLSQLTWQVSAAILWVVQLALSALLLAHQLLPAGRVPSAWNVRGLPDLMARPVAAAIAWSWCGTMAMLPWANLLYQAGRGQVLPGQYQWTASRFAEVMTQGAREFQGEIAWSLVIGSLATLCVIPLAGAIAWWARRSRVAGGVFALLLTGLAAFPAPLLGLWLLAACTPWKQAWIVWLTDQTVFLPILAVLLRQLPWAVLIAWFALRQIPKEQFESADLEGVPGWRQAIRIAAAQLPAAWLTIALVSLALSVGELSATLMVTPPAVSTVATRMFGLIHAGVRDKEAALALWNIAGCLLLSVCLVLLLPRLANNPGGPTKAGAAD